MHWHAPDLAKVSDHILVPEHFALHLGTHVLSKYAHIQKAFVTIEQLRWSRITVSGQDKPHTHAFHRDGDDKRVVQVTVSLDLGYHLFWGGMGIRSLGAMKRGSTWRHSEWSRQGTRIVLICFDSTLDRGLACGAKWNHPFS